MKKQILYLFTFLILVSCSGTQPTSSNDSVKDIDGNVYKTVKIGNQWWMAENLTVTHYRNGDKIPGLTDDDEWDNNNGAYCYYNNDKTNIEIYGRLYNWFAVDDSRNLAPEGWHVPSDDEWQVLVDYLGGDTLAGGKMKSSGTIEGATNENGFSALPGGYRYNHGTFDGLGTNPYFWSSTESSGGNAWHRYLYYDNSNVYRDDSGWKQAGYSVRCVKD
ncbi:fibrobacter succinogenes major paralogous domain-containing protein [candidate division KSB1 bacterium]|nr:fibrobacter succinogenes major paralogous domain-containing protein [candidate division KSB1 bacterium]